MTPGTFVRITVGPFLGMTGVIARVIGAPSGSEVYLVELTTSAEKRVFLAGELVVEQRTSESRPQ